MSINPRIQARFCLIGLCLSLLAACAGKSETEAGGAEHIGWRCDGDRLKRGEPCEQVRVVNGRQQTAVDTDNQKSAETKPVGDGERIAKTRELVLVGDLRPRPWQQQLPGFRVETNRKPNVVSASYRDDVAPVPEQAFSDELYSEGDNGRVPVEHNDGGTAPTTGFKNEPDSLPERVSQPAYRSDLEPAYTVQLGAFASAEEAQRFLERHKLLHLDITRGHHEKDGRRWHVLSFGVFTDRSSAEKAWAAATTNATDLEVWVRRLRR